MTAQNESANARAHLRICGRVQGVYYRASMIREAQQLGLNGWVRNCDDGSVEAIAEGPRTKLDALIAWCGQGPRGARVDGVDVHWEPPQRDFFGFAVKR
jgi:acylphosphatase